MRTNIDIDDDLMQQAMAASGAKSKKAVVEEALRRLVQLQRQGEAIEKLWGLATWVGPDENWFAPDPLDPEWNAELARHQKSQQEQQQNEDTTPSAVNAIGPNGHR